MINNHQQNQYNNYIVARNHFIANPDLLIELEEVLTNILVTRLTSNIIRIKDDYNEASYLYPFWQNYPPDDRGRQPIKDQYPWIEVGEHAIGSKLPRLFEPEFEVRDTGFPSGADQRFILTSPTIGTATHEFTNSAWLFVDIKSVGPRDDQEHTVMSHNQVSGDGLWNNPADGVRNTILRATGKRKTHEFHASIPPVFVLSDTTIAPLVMIALKPVYGMLPTTISGTRNIGQPLQRIDVACIPNGLLLTQQPNYLNTYPHLFFPGKDDKSKDPRKMRARVSFHILRTIAPWRVQTITAPYP